MSAALFERAGGGRHVALSAGTRPADRVHPEVVEVMRELGVDLAGRTPQPLTRELAERADVVVTMGCGDECPYIPGKRYLDWDLEDPKGRPLDEVRATRDEIERRVDELVAELDRARRATRAAATLRRSMRRILHTIALLACAAALVAGCGGDDSSGGPLEEALSYVPADTPFAIAIGTDVEGDQYAALDEVLGRFPNGDSLEDMLRQELEEGDEGVSYEEDVKPLLGNPFVVGATDIRTFVGESEDDDFVAAIQARDSEALDRLVEKTQPEEQGEVAGATVYEDDDTVFAIEDDIVVFAGTRQLLESALERADGGDGLDPDTFEESLDGLPGEALARAYIDLQALIEQDPDTEPARRVDWVAALRTMGLTASVQDDAVDVEFNMRTEGDLSEEDLPLAAGEEAPRVLQEPGEIGFGLRDPRQVATFFESAFQAVDPQSFGDYETGKRAVSQRYDIDVDEDVFGQLTGDTSVSVAVDGSFGARAEVEDPQAFTDTVDRLAEALPELGSGLGVTDVTRSGGLYEASLADGGRFVFGMSEDVFVAASDAARARELGSQEPSEVSDATGSLVMAADAEQLASQLLQQLLPQTGLGGAFGAGLFTRPLDQLSGSVESSTDGLRGRLRLTLD